MSVSIFTYDRFHVKANDSIIKIKNPIEIESVLVNKPFEYADHENNSDAPESVLDFVNSYSFISNVTVRASESRVVIYEIIDHIDNNKKLDIFLNEANVLLKGDKLTSPKGNNAFQRYQMVLSLDSDNKEALEGINRIVNRYVNLTERVIEKKETYKVASLIKNAYFVGENYIDMKPIIDKYSTYIDDKSVFFNVSSELIRNNSKAIMSNDDLSDTRKLPPVGRSIFYADKDIALAASKLMADGDDDGAIIVLQRFTSLSDYWGKSYDLLFSLYLKQFNFKQAELLVSTNTTLDTFQLAEKVSRLFIAGDDTEGALNLLNSHSPDINKYNEYYAVKAGLYHDRKQYKQAVNLYRKLINIEYDNSRYWLGLAVSLDAVSGDGVVDAFRYAYEYSLPNSNVKEYIEQRLLVLAQ